MSAFSGFWTEISYFRAPEAHFLPFRGSGQKIDDASASSMHSKMRSNQLIEYAALCSHVLCSALLCFTLPRAFNARVRTSIYIYIYIYIYICIRRALCPGRVRSQLSTNKEIILLPPPLIPSPRAVLEAKAGEPWLRCGFAVA